MTVVPFLLPVHKRIPSHQDTSLSQCISVDVKDLLQQVSRAYILSLIYQHVQVK